MSAKAWAFFIRCGKEFIFNYSCLINFLMQPFRLKASLSAFRTAKSQQQAAKNTIISGISNLTALF
jgi:uncharacterized membrane protein